MGAQKRKKIVDFNFEESKNQIPTVGTNLMLDENAANTLQQRKNVDKQNHGQGKKNVLSAISYLRF